MLFENKVLSLHKIGCTSAIPSKLDCIRFALSLHKIGCTSAIPSKLDCVRFALSLHKIGCTSAIPSKLDCVRFALSLNKIDSEPCAICLSFDYGAKDIIDSGYAAENSI